MWLISYKRQGFQNRPAHTPNPLCTLSKAPKKFRIRSAPKCVNFLSPMAFFFSAAPSIRWLSRALLRPDFATKEPFNLWLKEESMPGFVSWNIQMSFPWEIKDFFEIGNVQKRDTQDHPYNKRTHGKSTRNNCKSKLNTMHHLSICVKSIGRNGRWMIDIDYVWTIQNEARTGKMPIVYSGFWCPVLLLFRMTMHTYNIWPWKSLGETYSLGPLPKRARPPTPFHPIWPNSIWPDALC